MNIQLTEDIIKVASNMFATQAFITGIFLTICYFGLYFLFKIVKEGVSEDCQRFLSIIELFIRAGLITLMVFQFIDVGLAKYHPEVAAIKYLYKSDSK